MRKGGGSKVNKYEQVRGDARGLHGGGGGLLCG